MSSHVLVVSEAFDFLIGQRHATWRVRCVFACLTCISLIGTCISLISGMLSIWRSSRRSLHGATFGVCCLRGEREGVSSLEIFV